MLFVRTTIIKQQCKTLRLTLTKSEKSLSILRKNVNIKIRS